MNCWMTLGIEEYSDKKTIKVAYAKLLKITKPDDDPQGFKELHAAYKEALAQVSEYKEKSSPQWFSPPNQKNRAINYDDEFSHEVDQEPMPLDDGFVIDEDALNIEATAHTPPIHQKKSTEGTQKEPFVTAPTAPYAEQIDVDSEKIREELEEVFGTPKSETSKAASAVSHLTKNEQEYLDTEGFDTALEQKTLEDDWDYLVSQTKDIIQTKAAQSTINDWEFIEQIPSMIDLEFRSQASDLVFEIVSEINEISLEKKTLLVKEPILSYLNSLFHWNSKWQYYEELYGDRVEAIFPFITEKSTSQETIIKYKKELFYYRRLAAFMIDITIVSVFLVLLVTVFTIAKNDVLSLIVSSIAGYFFIIIPIMEALPTLQASLGKLVLGLKVVNSSGLCIPWYQSFWRAFVTMCCIAGFKIVLWVNLFLAYRQGILLQDSASSSFVIKVRE